MKIVVSGLINIETTLKINSFPIEYSPVLYPFFGIRSTVSGVGYNVSKALTVLGCKAPLLSLIGKDAGGTDTLNELKKCHIPAAGVLDEMNETPQSVILYDNSGRRQINVDLKDIQERNYPHEIFNSIAKDARIIALCNINFSRTLLPLAREHNIKIATDVHVLSDINDTYNHDFLNHADIIFLSNEAITGRELDFIRELKKRYCAEVICIGMGERGVMIYSRTEDTVYRYGAVRIREIVNTIGAGDALFSSFI